MPVRVIEDTVEKDVTFLRDIDVKFVSLVRHGACQMPFRVIKSEGKGGDLRDMMIIQSLLVPKHLDLANLTGKEELGWLADANTDDGTDFEEYRTFTQETPDLFEADTMKMVKVHDDGVWVLAGTLKEGASPEKGITIGTKEETSAKEIPVTPMEAPIPATVSASAAMSFKDLFYRELDHMLGVVTGTLNQSGQKLNVRKKTILGALDAFRSFLVMGLDAVGENAVKVVKEEMLGRNNQPTGEEENMELFKTQEEFAEAMRGVLKETIPGMIDEHLLALQTLKDAETTQPEGTQTTEEPATTKTEEKTDPKLLETIQALKQEVDDLKKKWDENPATESTTSDGEDGSQKGSGEEGNDPSVFKGLLYRVQ